MKSFPKLICVLLLGLCYVLPIRAQQYFLNPDDITGVLELARALGGLNPGDDNTPIGWNARLNSANQIIRTNFPTSSTQPYQLPTGMTVEEIVPANVRITEIFWDSSTLDNYLDIPVTGRAEINVLLDAASLSAVNLTELRTLNLGTHQGLRGTLNLGSFTNLQITAIPFTGISELRLPLGGGAGALSPLREIFTFGSQSLNSIQVPNLNYQNLDLVIIDSCAFHFGDIAALVQQLGMTQIMLNRNALPSTEPQIAVGATTIPLGANEYYPHYASSYNFSNLPPDSISGTVYMYDDPILISLIYDRFRYDNQVPVGIGGVRRRPQGDTIDLIIPHRDPSQTVNAIFDNSRTDITWFISLDSSSIEPITGIPPTPILGTTIYDAGLSIYSGTAFQSRLIGNNHQSLRFPAITQALDSQYIRARLLHKEFPYLDLYTPIKRLSVGPCLDSLNQPVRCQEMLVQLRPGMSPQEQAALLKDLGMEVVETCSCNPDLQRWAMSDTIRTLVLNSNGKGTREVTSTSAQTKPELLSADPNYNASWPNGLNSPALGLGPAAIANPNVRPTLVAVLDAGVDLQHLQLNDRLFVNAAEDLPFSGTDSDGDCAPDNRWGYDFLNNQALPNDDHGHGTQVAGILSGKTPNSIRPNLQAFDSIALVPLRFTDSRGRGTVYHAACALYHAAQYSKHNGESRVRVINASFGYQGEECGILTQAFVDAGANEDLLIICSAGNSGVNNDNNPHWPSDYAHLSRADSLGHVIAVAAIANPNSETLASYSNYGAQTVSLAAVGNDSSFQLNQPLGKVAVSGTSFAAPQVSRAAGLLFARFPSACPSAIKFALLRGVDTLQSTDAAKLYSAGKLNYLKALQILENMNPAERDDCAFFTGTLPAQSQTAVIGQWQLFPNPAQTQVSLRFPQGLEGQVNWKLLGLDGRSFNQGQVQAETRSLDIDLQALPSGLYLLELQSQQGLQTLKLLRQP